MFTGIIEAVALIRSISDRDMWLEVPFACKLKLGQSVACDGVCLTVVEIDEQGFRVEFLEETKKLTNFGSLSSGLYVNVERAMKVNDRFDGHIVQAHVEGLGILMSVQRELGASQERDSSVSSSSSSSSSSLQDATENSVGMTKGDTWLLTLEVSKELMKYMIHKGIVILNGIALTIVDLNEEKLQLRVAIIPHTWENTNLSRLQEGAVVNVETDVIAKYVERMVG
ncbi:MAG: riboflavin synthase [Candidatus Gracilibacteria bacterium]|nr:riboflavin synthase [Candidatus Gracilibacteria bacterium]